MTKEISDESDDELFAQIATNMRIMSDTILSHEAQIKRLNFRIDRLEKVHP